MAHLVQLKGQQRSDAKRAPRTSSSGRAIKTPANILTSEDEVPRKKKSKFSSNVTAEIARLQAIVAQKSLQNEEGTVSQTIQKDSELTAISKVQKQQVKSTVSENKDKSSELTAFSKPEKNRENPNKRLTKNEGSKSTTFSKTSPTGYISPKITLIANKDKEGVLTVLSEGVIEDDALSDNGIFSNILEDERCSTRPQLIRDGCTESSFIEVTSENSHNTQYRYLLPSDTNGNNIVRVIDHEPYPSVEHNEKRKTNNPKDPLIENCLDASVPPCNFEGMMSILLTIKDQNSTIIDQNSTIIEQNNRIRREMSQNVDDRESKLGETLYEPLEGFPLITVEQFVELNSNEQKITRRKLYRHLINLGGSKLREFLNYGLREIMTDELVCEFTWPGVNASQTFGNTKVANLLYLAVKECPLFKGPDDKSEFKQEMLKVLRITKQRFRKAEKKNSIVSTKKIEENASTDELLAEINRLETYDRQESEDEEFDADDEFQEDKGEEEDADI